MCKIPPHKSDTFPLCFFERTDENIRSESLTKMREGTERYPKKKKKKKKEKERKKDISNFCLEEDRKR